MSSSLSFSIVFIFIFAGLLNAQTLRPPFVFQGSMQTSTKTICFLPSKEVPFEQVVEIMDNPVSTPPELEHAARILTGLVFDNTGAELVGAEIGFHLATFHATTDVKGKYAITIPGELKQLSFFEDGMDRGYVDVKQTNELNVQLLNYGGEGIDQMFEKPQYTQPSSRNYAIKEIGRAHV